MAVYQVGNIITYINPENTEQEISGEIIEILTDIELGATEESYLVAPEEANQGISQIVPLDHIVDIENIPTVQSRQTRGLLVNDEMGNIRTETAFRTLHPNPWNYIVPTSNSVQESLSFQFIDLQDPSQRNVETITEDQVVAELSPPPISNLRNPPIELPIINGWEDQFFSTLTSNDYDPRPERPRLVRFQVEGRILTPVFTDNQGVFRFYDEIGRIWVNNIQALFNREWNSETIIDRSGVRWLRLSIYRELSAMRERREAPTVISKSKKKLRQKYTEMPIIKEEKYYANKKYIA